MTTSDITIKLRKQRAVVRREKLKESVNLFSVKYRTRSNTQQSTITLKGASAKSKAKITLPKTPWDA